MTQSSVSQAHSGVDLKGFDDKSETDPRVEPLTVVQQMHSNQYQQSISPTEQAINKAMRIYGQRRYRNRGFNPYNNSRLSRSIAVEATGGIISRIGDSTVGQSVDESVKN